MVKYVLKFRRETKERCWRAGMLVTHVCLWLKYIMILLNQPVLTPKHGSEAWIEAFSFTARMLNEPFGFTISVCSVILLLSMKANLVHLSKTKEQRIYRLSGRTLYLKGLTQEDEWSNEPRTNWWAICRNIGAYEFLLVSISLFISRVSLEKSLHISTVKGCSSRQASSLWASHGRFGMPLHKGRGNESGTSSNLEQLKCGETVRTWQRFFI